MIFVHGNKSGYGFKNVLDGSRIVIYSYELYKFTECVIPGAHSTVQRLDLQVK